MEGVMEGIITNWMKLLRKRRVNRFSFLFCCCEMAGLETYNRIVWCDEPGADGLHGIVPDVSTCFIGIRNLSSFNRRQGLQ